MDDILLLNLNWKNAKLNDRINNFEPLAPLELMYISGGLDRLGIENDLIDLWALNRNIKEIKNEITKAKIILLTTAQSYFYWREGINIDFPKENINLIRRYNKIAKIIIVGPQGTVKPEIFFEEDINFIIRGEPDAVAPKLICDIVNSKKTYLPGVCIREEKTWKQDNSFATVNNLSRLPLLGYGKLKVDSYDYPERSPTYNPKNVAIYEASRGCPNNCIFCFRVNFRDKFRKKSITQIRKELKILEDCNINYVYLIDEIFGVDKEWSELVCSELKRHGIKWRCQTRPELLDKKFIRIMANSGCLMVDIGLESTDRRILKFLNKSDIDLNKFKEDISYIIRQNIQPTILCIIGSPYETKITIKRTLDYILSFPLDKIKVYAKLMLPYPHTKLWKMGLKENKDLIDFKSIGYNAGIIMNNFKNTFAIRNECVRFNNIIWYKQIKKKLKKYNNNQFIFYFRAYRYKILICFPWLDNLIENGIYKYKQIRNE